MVVAEAFYRYPLVEEDSERRTPLSQSLWDNVAVESLVRCVE